MTQVSKLNELSLAELEPYTLGKKFVDVCKDVPRLNRQVFEQFMTMLNNDPIAKQFFDAYEDYKDFYKTAVDFKNLIPKEYQMECFYAAKNGCFYVEIPSFCVYMVKRAYKEANGIPNLIPLVLPHAVLKKFFSQDYFLGGLTLRDVICNLCNENYNPLSLTRLKNRVGDFTEIYIQSTDMVAAVPNDIADFLDDKGIEGITLGPNGLITNGVLLRSMCNRVGGINSFYDLRELI